MTKEDFIEEYGDIVVSYSGYRKFQFTFIGETADSTPIVILIGGSSAEIYGMEIDCNETAVIRDMEMIYCKMIYGRVGFPDESIAEFNNFGAV